MELKKYHTGLITIDYHLFPSFPYQGKGWKILLRNVPNNLHPRMSMREIRISSKGKDSIHKGKEIIIEAPSFLAAQRAANLIHSAILLLDNSGYTLGTEREVLPIQTTMDKETQNSLRWLLTTDLPLACMIAAKASFRREYSYALAKLRVSFEMVSTNWIDLDPFHSPNIPKSPYPEHHVRFAYGIILAYAVIEEIGLEIRASKKNPSTINGQWNPVVKQELEQRLQDAGIDISETFFWNVRGSATTLEKARPPKKISKAPWSRYDVRDVTMELVDAIAHVSWLRSRVSSHKMETTLVKVLSRYDVANAQFLARSLLLGKMGFWRSMRVKS